MHETWVQSLGWKDPLEEGKAILQYSCLENPHGQRSLAGYSPWGRKESDTTEQLSTAQHSTLTDAITLALAQNNAILSAPHPHIALCGLGLHIAVWACEDTAHLVRLRWLLAELGKRGRCVGIVRITAPQVAGREFTEMEVKVSFPEFCWPRAPHQTQPDGFLAAKSLAAASFRRLPTTEFLRFAQLSSLAT